MPMGFTCQGAGFRQAEEGECENRAAKRCRENFHRLQADRPVTNAGPVAFRRRKRPLRNPSLLGQPFLSEPYNSDRSSGKAKHSLVIGAWLLQASFEPGQ